MIPGEYLLGEGDIDANVGRETVQVTVANTGDRPIQVGSHFHFFEANRGAARSTARGPSGMRLNIPAGTAVRFEPGDEKAVTLVELAGAREVHGLNGLTDGPAGDGTPGRRPRAGGARTASGRARAGSGRMSPPHPAPAVRGPVRSHRRRPGAPGRHRAPHRGRARLHRLRRRGEVRRRQGDPRRHGPVGPGHVGRRWRARSRHHQCADPRPLGHREGRYRRARTAASSAWARRGTPTSWRA